MNVQFETQGCPPVDCSLGKVGFAARNQNAIVFDRATDEAGHGDHGADGTTHGRRKVHFSAPLAAYKEIEFSLWTD